MATEQAVAMAADRRELLAELLLLAVAAVWGTTFVLVKNALADIGPFYFLAQRFLAAFALLWAMYWRRVRASWRRALRPALFIGLLLFAGYALQTVGLMYTTAANSGFITGLNVALVPLLAAALYRQRPDGGTVLGAGVATLGLALLSLSAEWRINYGDVLTLGCAVAFALQIVGVGRYAPRQDAVVLAVLQVGVVGVVSAAAAVALEPAPLFSPPVWWALAVTTVFATALAFVVQNTMQCFTTAARTALIFASEPVFAGATAFVALGEVLSVRQLLGCALILAGMIMSELLKKISVTTGGGNGLSLREH